MVTGSNQWRALQGGAGLGFRRPESCLMLLQASAEPKRRVGAPKNYEHGQPEIHPTSLLVTAMIAI